MMDWVQETFGEGSAFQAALTLLRYPLGIAFFLLPWAMKFGGIVAGPIVIAIFVIINAYRSYVITRVADKLTANGVKSPSGYNDLWMLENSIGNVGRTAASFCCSVFSIVRWLSLLGHASAFLAFAGLNFNQIFPIEGLLGVKGHRVWIVACAGVVVFSHFFIQSLRALMHKSECVCVHVCSAFTLILLPAIFAVFFGMPTIVNFSSQLAASQAPIHPSVAVDWKNFGLEFAGIVFITGATPEDVTGTYGTIKNRSSFSTVLIIVATTLMIIGTGFPSAVFLGLDGHTCESITFSLPLTGRFIALRFFSSSCALIFISFRHQIGAQSLLWLSASEILCDILFKVVFLVVTGALAFVIPSYAGIACIFGSLTSFPLTMTFPFLCDLMLHVTGGNTPESMEERKDLLGSETLSVSREATIGPETHKSAVRIIRDVVFMILGLTGIAYGLYTTISYLQLRGVTHVTANCA